ncbi:DUF819 family protein [Maribacter sp. PR1]|uniref:DUF819 family protein n=1 Tax=Maribacter cobaltidurans TaxID=1178778 RepID=A0ABU7IY11_9FLAO|nr:MULTISPECIES: DUF819 family protein [Maribacter]MDC6390323.1 DUF819 family protein [Maribacter sp. PR1]MEE1977713.1 DUF819 family protein [Maribacter cobaltidurans]
MMFTNHSVFVLFVLCLMVLLSIYSAKTKWGKPLGAALLVILFTAVLANMGVIPSASNSIPLYDGIFTYLAPLSIFYLLLGANLREIKKAGLPMLGLFLLGSLATVLGIFIAWYLVGPDQLLEEDAKVLAGMLTGTYTGGSVNFNAVALIYDFQEKGLLYAGAIAVDNVVTAFWVIATIALPKTLRARFKDKNLSIPGDEAGKDLHEKMGIFSLAMALVIGFGALFLSEMIHAWWSEIPTILVISTFGIALAQFPFIKKLEGVHSLGLYIVYLFLAVIGAYCEIGAVLDLQQIGLTLLGFTLVAVALHGVIIIALGGLFFRDWDMVAIASQANVGGGTSAIALAETFDRNELILPAILVGTLGNALGTYLGFFVVSIL